jgi:hypothetical protein
MGCNAASALWRGNKGGARSSDLARLQWQGKLERGVLNHRTNNRCTRGRRERGLGVLGESLEEVTWRDHRDDTTWNVRVSVIWQEYSDVLIWYVVRPNADVIIERMWGENVVWWWVAICSMTWPKVEYTVTWLGGLWCNPVIYNHGKVTKRRVKYTWCKVRISVHGSLRSQVF